MTHYQTKIVSQPSPQTLNTPMATTTTVTTSASTLLMTFTDYLSIIASYLIESINKFTDTNEYIVIYGKTSKVHTILTLTYLGLFICLIVFIMTRIRVFK